MLSSKHRIVEKKDFKKIFRNGRGAKESFLVLKVLPNNLGYSRFAFIVSSKVSKKAVERNRIKRRLRYIIKKRLPYVQGGVDGIFIALPGIKEKSFSEVEKTVTIILKRLRVLGGENG